MAVFNIGGSELLVIFLVALIALGPEKLPKVARQAGQFMAQMRKLSDGFRTEIKAAMDDVMEMDARKEGAKLTASETAAPELHEVKAVAEPDIHPVLDQGVGAEPTEPTEPKAPGLRSVQDPKPGDDAGGPDVAAAG